MAGLLGTTLQLRRDVSASSDVAIGSAALFGIRYRENFAVPFRYFQF